MSNHALLRSLAVLGAGGLIVAGADASSAATTFTLREKIVESHLDDAGPAGPSLGDRLIFVSEMRDGAVRAGRAVGDCTWYAGASERTAQYYCTVVFRLRGGDLVITGLFSYARETNTFPVTGGTGRYRGVTGDVVVRTLTAETFEDTFRLR